MAFSPAGISSFFEICDRTPDGAPIRDPERVGSRGGGFVISKGVLTKVNITEAKEKQIRVFINERLSPEAETTSAVVEALLKKTSEAYHVTVRHRVDVQIGAGFGSSAAGALSTALALSNALNINLTYNQLGRIAHIAEVKCKTGLGTVGALMLGGCIVTTEPGAPGYASIDRIPIPSDHRIIAITYKPYPTKEILSSQRKRRLIKKWGRKTLDKILADPSLRNFMCASKEFAKGAGLITNRVEKLIEIAEKAGAIGAAQNMVGEAVHALVTSDKLEEILQVLSRHVPKEKIITSKIDRIGAQLIV
jgi:pantoate kinase